jgi:hypothetical protein
MPVRLAGGDHLGRDELRGGHLRQHPAPHREIAVLVAATEAGVERGAPFGRIGIRAPAARFGRLAIGLFLLENQRDVRADLFDVRMDRFELLFFLFPQGFAAVGVRGVEDLLGLVGQSQLLVEEILFGHGLRPQSVLA